VSQHLAVLRDGGLVTVRRDGTRRLYQANREALGPLGQVLEQMWATQLDELATLAEAAEREQRR
jgi:DNA-binding transcriptional ArsR family regulator